MPTTSSSTFPTCYLKSIDRQAFDVIRQDQKISCQYEDYPTLLQRIFSDCQENLKNHSLEFYIRENSNAILEINTKNEFRKFLLLHLEFNAIPEDLVRSSMAFRFSVLKVQNEILEQRLKDIIAVIRKSNPSLALVVVNNLTAL